MPHFSVVIPSYNRCEFLKIALKSVWSQTFKDYEAIVVDDGSTDGTWEYLQSLGNRVISLRQENSGPGAARNLGASRANGDYLAFLDSDDVWFPWTLETFAAEIKNHKANLISGSVKIYSNYNELDSVASDKVDSLVFSDYFSASRTGYYLGPGMGVVRRESFIRVGGFTKVINIAEDHDLAIRLGIDPGFIKILSPITLGYRRHNGGITQNFPKTLEGINFLIAGELSGRYPGGRKRRKERLRILSRHVRPVALQCLKYKEGISYAWYLYFQTFHWQVSLQKWKFILGFPFVFLWRKGVQRK